MYKCIFLFVVSVVFLSCTNNGIVMERPDDFSVTLEKRTGSIPPEYYYESTTVFTADTCSITFYPGYTDSVLLSETFTLPQDSLDALYRLMEKQQIFSTTFDEVEDPPVGGGTSNLLIVSNGETYKVPEFPKESELVEPVYVYLWNLIPKEIIAEWEKIHQKYIDDYQNQQQQTSKE